MTVGPPAPAAEQVDAECLPPKYEDPPNFEELQPLATQLEHRVPVTVMGEGAAITEIIIVMGQRHLLIIIKTTPLLRVI